VLGDNEQVPNYFWRGALQGLWLSVKSKRQIEFSVDSAVRQRLDWRLKVPWTWHLMNFKAIPIAQCLRNCRGYSRKSAGVIRVFPVDYELLLGKRQNFHQRTTRVEQIRKRIASGFILLATFQALAMDLASIESGRRAQLMEAPIVVAPPRDQFLFSLTQWLPEEIIVIAERGFVDRPAASYGAFAAHPDLAVSDGSADACQCAMPPRRKRAHAMFNPFRSRELL